MGATYAMRLRPEPPMRPETPDPRLKIYRRWQNANQITYVRGKCENLLPKVDDGSIDLILTSPPYCIGKVYENERNADDFFSNHEMILPEMVRLLKPGGSLCWQVGYHTSNGVLTPLDFVVYRILSAFKEMILRNRIVWTFGHGLHHSKRFDGRHETILWFTKEGDYSFDLDSVRVEQKYPGKRSYKGERKGELSGNPLGKNPGDVWEMPNVNAGHVEKTGHPCQFPVALAARLIKALSKEGELVFDPYAGVATTGVAAVLNQRRFLGAEINEKYHAIGEARLQEALKGNLRVRDDKPPWIPPANSRLTTVPESWTKLRT